MLCFDAKTPPLMVQVQSVNTGNASCGQFSAELQGPNGQRYFSLGVAPQTVLLNAGAGRYYESVTYIWGSCPTLRFTVVK